MNVFESIRQEILKRASPAASTPATGLQDAPRHDLAAHELIGEQIVAVLSTANANGSEKLHWQTSVVGLMNILGLDPSSSNLKLLSQELGCADDSTDPNGRLHRAVMQKLTVPGG